MPARDAGAEKPFACQFLRKASGDEFELVLLIVSGIDLQPAFRPTERHVDERTLVRHESRQSLDLVRIDRWREAQSALDREAMLAVDRAPTAKDTVAAFQLDGKLHTNNRVADTDLVSQPRRKIEGGDRSSEHLVNASKKIGCRDWIAGHIAHRNPRRR